jgi:cell division septation protein DedD
VVAKLKQAGVGQVVKSRSHKGEQMHRLFLADFADKNEAQEELERLRLAAPSAFMLKENGRYAIYAGSYLRGAKAAQEQDRLYEKGVKLVVKTATAPVAVVRLRAGAFAERAAAERTAERLKKSGVQAKVVKVQK